MVRLISATGADDFLQATKVACAVDTTLNGDGNNNIVTSTATGNKQIGNVAKAAAATDTRWRKQIRRQFANVIDFWCHDAREYPRIPDLAFPPSSSARSLRKIPPARSTLGGVKSMTPLSEIRLFPVAVRDTLETEFGINSAEAFFEHSVRNPAGLAAALKLAEGGLDPLTKLVEGHLPLAFVTRCRQPSKTHKRGVIVTPPRPPKGEG